MTVQKKLPDFYTLVENLIYRKKENSLLRGKLVANEGCAESSHK